MSRKQRKIIINAFIIVIILTIVFLSQQTYFKEISKNPYSQRKDYLGKVGSWLRTNIYSKLGGEVEKRGEVVKKEVNQQKDNIVKSIWEKIKNYLAEKFSKFSGTKVE